MSNLYATKYHTLTVGEIVDSRGQASNGYQVTNLKTGVVEFEGFNFVECTMFMDEMAPRLDKFYMEEPGGGSSNVVSH